MNADDLSNVSGYHDDGADLFEGIIPAGDLSNISGYHDDVADLYKEIIPAGDLSHISGYHDDGADLNKEIIPAGDLSNISGYHDDGADLNKEVIPAGDLSNISGYHDNGADLNKEIIPAGDLSTHQSTISLEIIPVADPSSLIPDGDEPERSVDNDGDKNCDKESDKENEENLNRSANTKKQFKLIAQFMNEYDGAPIETKTFNKRWEELVSELNLLGPPPFTETQWRSLWAQHKYNQKLSTSKAEIAATPHRDKQSHYVLPGPLEEIVLTSRETAKSIAEVSDKLTVIIKKDDAILQALQVGNNLLKEISESLKPQHL